MEKTYSKSWRKSKKPGKQRKYKFNAPLHVLHNFLGVHLSKELQKKHGRRTIGARKGDKVTVMRGQHKKKEGKIERISLKKGKVYITGIEHIKKDGSKSMYPFQPSNLMIKELESGDKKRMKPKEKGAKNEKSP